MVKEFKKFELKTFESRWIKLTPAELRDIIPFEVRRVGYKLTPIELRDIIPFEVRRVYYVTDFETGDLTGTHCHKIEEEVFVIVKGSCAAIIDCGKGLEEIKLNGPSDAIYVPNFVWHGFKDASSDCVILALSSTNYSPSREDYIEDYEEFKKISPYYHQG